MDLTGSPASSGRGWTWDSREGAGLSGPVLLASCQQGTGTGLSPPLPHTPHWRLGDPACPDPACPDPACPTAAPAPVMGLPRAWPGGGEGVEWGVGNGAWGAGLGERGSVLTAQPGPLCAASGS